MENNMIEIDGTIYHFELTKTINIDDEIVITEILTDNSEKYSVEKVLNVFKNNFKTKLLNKDGGYSLHTFSSIVDLKKEFNLDKHLTVELDTIFRKVTLKVIKPKFKYEEHNIDNIIENKLKELLPHHNREKTAEMLGISERTIYRLIKKFGIKE